MQSAGVACKRPVSFSFQHPRGNSMGNSHYFRSLSVRKPSAMISMRNHLLSAAANPSLGSPSALNTTKKARDLRKDKFLELELEVRDYELDKFGVVKNYVYASYCQHGLQKLGDLIKVNTKEVAFRGDALAIAESSLKFLAPLRSGDKFLVRVIISKFTIARIFAKIFIVKLPNQEGVLEANVTCVFLDSEYRAKRLSKELRENLDQVLSTEGVEPLSSIINGSPKV